MKWIISLLAILFVRNTSAQTDYGFIINAPSSDPSYYYDILDHNTLKFFRTMKLSGISRDKITIFNSDGRNPFANKNVSDREFLLSGIPSNQQYSNAKATRLDIRNKFLKLAKMAKAGDHLHLYITGHGLSKNGKIYLTLWGEELSVEELGEYLKLLPPGMSKHIVGNFCFSGSLISLSTLPNTCVFSSVDEKSTMKVETKRDVYTGLFMDRLKAGVNYYDAQKFAESNDEKNGMGLNSLDWFLANHAPKEGFSCEKVVDGNVDALLRSLLQFQVSTDWLNEAYLKAFNLNKRQLDKLIMEYDGLSPKEKNLRIGDYTRSIESMKQKINLIDFPQRQQYVKQLAREQEFIEHANPELLKTYLNIKACVNYAIKK